MTLNTMPDSLSPSTSDTDVLLDWLSGSLHRILGTGKRGAIFAVLGAAIGSAVALMLPLQFTSSTAFIAQGASTSLVPSALRGLAASVGLSSARDFSPQFYVELLTSEPVLMAALSRKYAVAGAAGPVERTYYEIEGFNGPDRAAETEKALRYLRKRVAARADVRTNIVSLSVDARYPGLSRDIAGTLLQALDSLNIRFRQEQSHELREFFETRVRQAQSELDTAETALRHFLERNRLTQNSPLLQFEQLRLTRAADLKRTVYMTVVEQFEEAKLQESRNVPVLTVLTEPTLPVKKSGPPRRFIVVAVTVLTFSLIFALQAWQGFLQHFRSHQTRGVGAIESSRTQ
jgi:uncharacterized protein involved in exopolysaccharide biosynthesis